jgi:uncharacterized protein
MTLNLNMTPIEMISTKCREIEAANNVKIIFCVEGGSRVWRMDSKNSDYDIRFVYSRPVNDYISINSPADVIKHCYDIDGNNCQPEGAVFDFVGFDIFKFLRMLHSSNPQVIEWLTSDIVYYGKQPDDLVNYAKNYFNPISLYYHYKAMARENYIKYIKSGAMITYKKYLYAMRGLVNSKIVAVDKKVPSIDFNATLLDIQEHYPRSFMPPEIVHRLLEIIDLKRQGREKEIIENEVRMNEYIEHCLKDDSDVPPKRQMVPFDLDTSLRKIIGVI